MKLLFAFFLSLVSYNCTSQNCINSNFSLGDFSNWSGTTGTVPNNGGTPYDTPGFIIGQHEIITTQFLDSYTGNALIVPPPGNNFVCKLGNTIAGYGAESISYQINVDQSNRLFIYEYSLVLENPGHAIIHEPRFIVKITDVNGNIIPGDCSYYETYGGDTNNNFNQLPMLTYSPWQKVAIDLSQYIGQTLKIQFTTMDCGLGAHWGYAYLTAKCRPYSLDLNTQCNGNVTISAPDGFESYSWTPGGYTTQTIQLSLQQGGTFTYSCEMIPNTGLACLEQIDTTFTIIQEPIELMSDTTICLGETVVLNFNPPQSNGSYLWTGFNIENEDLIISPTLSTPVILEYIDSNSCLFFDSIMVNVNPLPEIITDLISTCYLDTFSLNPIPNNYIYTYSLGFENNIIYQAINSISPLVTFVDPATGCMNNDTLQIIVHPKPIASFFVDCEKFPPIIFGNSTGSIQYNWVINNEVFNNLSPEEFIEIQDNNGDLIEISLIAINEFGCADSITELINYPAICYVPNTFTPDGNEFNNFFRPVFNNELAIKDYSFSIFSRWGELIFISQNVNYGWDGSFGTNGKRCQDGTYTWILTFTDTNCNSLEKEIIGHVNLIK